MRQPLPPLSHPGERRSSPCAGPWCGGTAPTGATSPGGATRDPYRVLVSELMLQQQTVRHVTPVFVRFLDRFPTLEVLAAASPADVIRVWQPLGRYSSAVRLHTVARRLVGEAGGAVPATVAALLPLEGIGRYTAGAIVCFAHGIPAPLVDTNVRRVLGRIFAQEAPGAGEDDRSGLAPGRGRPPGAAGVRVESGLDGPRRRDLYRPYPPLPGMPRRPLVRVPRRAASGASGGSLPWRRRGVPAGAARSWWRRAGPRTAPGRPPAGVRQGGRRPGSGTKAPGAGTGARSCRPSAPSPTGNC